jgi:hypothetical protein
MLLLPAPGVSRPTASDLMRFMSRVFSARTTRLLVRASTATAAFGTLPGALAGALVSGTTRCSICAMSMAEAFSRRMIWTSDEAGRSTDWMMRWMRRTLLA